MIAVIADDFTGAAELAGIALQYNLSVMLCTGDIVANNVDVLVLSTDSRSLNKAHAIEVTEKAVTALQKLHPAYIYKKVDSVLRGHVLDELHVQLSFLGFERALLLPSNPSLGRTIENKKYYINDTEISETSFANDPEFAIKDSSISAMLRSRKQLALSVLKVTDELPSHGVIVGEVKTEEDIDSWINRTDSSFIFAGGGDFFEKLLQKSFSKKPLTTEVNLALPHLYVSGTSFKNSADAIENIAKNAGGVHYLSVALMQISEDTDWFKQVSASIQENQKAVIAIDESLKQTIAVSALELRQAMAKSVAEIVRNENISELFIEGGATAAAILQELNLQNFVPVHQLLRGVIRMKALQKELYITVKPGSYKLPKQLSELYLK
ncbi:MAG TPA: four-carbon acid sugar kinase family protein [Pelobium sp.]|nr:four-carbon acid sugar kinase family protein [Pelobium sp.]